MPKKGKALIWPSVLDSNPNQYDPRALRINFFVVVFVQRERERECEKPTLPLAAQVSRNRPPLTPVPLSLPLPTPLLENRYAAPGSACDERHEAGRQCVDSSIQHEDTHQVGLHRILLLIGRKYERRDCGEENETTFYLSVRGTSGGTCTSVL